jgi:hypothetical protein
MAKTPTISVIERRLQGPSVFRESSQPIPLKEPKRWTLRWENSSINPNHLWDLIHVKGWAYAEPSDLECGVEEIGAFTEDGRIVRGERGQREILIKMLARDYARVARRKDEETRKNTFGKKPLKEAIVSGVATEHGERAADFIAKNVDLVSVSDSRGPEPE